ncbi:basic helix-loop-helix protein [Sporothrix epigloea]|uniref:Basic helix-loop-helix protein n=1 Tax=Sporothrix epigloea TaxID=1892477 RepID=A0ABP0D5D9_9PEZI
MAEIAAQQPPDLAPASPTQKRKRVDPGSPDMRRSKRGAAAAIEAAATAYMEDPGPPEETAEFAADQKPAAAAAPAPVSASVSTPSVPAPTPAPVSAPVTAPPPVPVAESSEAAPIDERAATHNGNTLDAPSTAAAALGSMFPQLNVPVPTEQTFANQHVDIGEHPDNTTAFSTGDVAHGGDMSLDASSPNGTDKPHTPGMQAKPAVGSEEWHRLRKDNHKEVERRRRETINEGINELAKIVPGCEKNKGAILQRAVVFITQLKENETQNIEKWTLEKLLTEQAIAELSASNDKLKAELERLYGELETWRTAAQDAGLQVPQKSEPPEPSEQV